MSEQAIRNGVMMGIHADNDHRSHIALDDARREVERLRGIVGRAIQFHRSHPSNHDSACAIIEILREVDVPTVPSGFPGNLLREADASPVFVAGRFVGPHLEADAPPAARPGEAADAALKGANGATAE